MKYPATLLSLALAMHPAFAEEPKPIGAPEPAKAEKASPLSPEEERAGFTLPPGFEAELVATEDAEAGIGKFVTVAFDQRGRMWSITALEYPVDGNESPQAAEALYAAKSKDKVLVFDTPFASGVQKPRVFADGLAQPLGVLPYKDGCFVTAGHDVEFLHDKDDDGKADAEKEVILKGFGIQDSHLRPHQFTRAPGGWIWMAQGAFNSGVVKTTRSEDVDFGGCRMAKFRPDGSSFESTSTGPCNIWGLVINGEGEAFIQEANDFGYPVMPFHEYGNYPGCANHLMKSYAPHFPPMTDFRVGGTGLSGLALTDAASADGKAGAFPTPWADVMLLANPITCRINAIKMHRDGPRWRLEQLPDFMASSDGWFRPVAITIGPDGCLYIVDWYNKIISHNEVARNHPDRDKVRGRIWRVKHKEQKPFVVPDFTKISGDELLAKLGGESLAQSHLAWQAMVDRGMTDLQMKLLQKTLDKTAPTPVRLASLWALNEITPITPWNVTPFLLTDSDRNIRREAVALGMVYRKNPSSVPLQATAEDQYLKVLAPMLDDPDPEVRATVIRGFSSLMSAYSGAGNLTGIEGVLQALLARVGEPLATPMGADGKGRPMKIKEAYDRDFERYLIRQAMERPAIQKSLQALLDAPKAERLSVEARILALLASDPKTSASRVAQLMPELKRPPEKEEIMRMAQFPDESGVSQQLKDLLARPPTGKITAQHLIAVRTSLDVNKVGPLLGEVAGKLLVPEESRDFAIDLVAAFKLAQWEETLVDLLKKERARTEARTPKILGLLKALAELNSVGVEVFGSLLREHPDAAVREAALTALGSSRSDDAGAVIFSLWSKLSPAQCRATLGRLVATKPGAKSVLVAVQTGLIGSGELDAPMREKLQLVLKEDAALTAQLAALPPPASAEDAAAVEAKFVKYRPLADKGGDVEKGKVVGMVCQACHLMGSAGGNIGPNLSGVGAMGTEAILRNIITPNAAMEAGYRTYRVEMNNGDLLDGFFVKEDADAVVVRIPGADERRIDRKDIKKASWLTRSLMPEGLIEAMTPEQVSDLFAFLKTLK